MKVDKEKLSKLLGFVEEIAEQPGNEWFKVALRQKLDKQVNAVADPKIDEIYELCIGKVVAEQAAAFYKDFPLKDIKDQLIADHARMERYRRENDIENFCLAAYQQMENIVNRLADNTVGNYIRDNADVVTHSTKNLNSNTIEKQKLKGSIFLMKYLSNADLQVKFKNGISRWHFAEKLKAVTFYYMFSRDLTRYVTFNLLMADGIKLANLRNTIHRGTPPSPEQLRIAQEVKADKERYYIRFLTFLNEFTGLVFKPFVPPIIVATTANVTTQNALHTPIQPATSAKRNKKNL